MQIDDAKGEGSMGLIKTAVKVAAVAMVVTLVVAAVAGCGGDKDLEEETDADSFATRTSTQVIAESFLDGVTFNDSMAVLDKDTGYELYGLSQDDCYDLSVIGSTGATAEEVAVCYGTPEQMEKIQKAFDGRIQAQRAGFENYVPAELDKLKDPFISKGKDYIIMVVCNDTKEADAKLAELMK